MVRESPSQTSQWKHGYLPITWKWLRRSAKGQREQKPPNILVFGRMEANPNRRGTIDGNGATKTGFISFDFDNDARLKDALVGQARYPNSPFSVADWSLKEEQKEREWKAKAKARINRSEIVVVICGTRTHSANGVASELTMAQELRKPYFLLKGHPDKQCTKPSTATQSDKIYTWSWDNLEKLITGRR